MTNSLHQELPDAGEFEQLMQCLLENSASELELARLATLLGQDQVYRREYIERINLHAALAWHAKCTLGGDADAVSHDLLACLAEALPLSHDLVVEAAVFRDDVEFAAHLSPSNPADRLWRRRWLATCVAGLVFYGLFALLSWNLRPNEPVAANYSYGEAAQVEQMQVDKSPTSSLPAGAVAQLGQTIDLQWKQELAQRPSTQFVANEAMAISSGIAEVNLASGVRLVVQGPAELQMQGENAAKLAHGSLVAQVPPQAIGFTVETPTARVVDLGTEFGIKVTDDAATHVSVLRGAVRIDPDSGQTSRQPEILIAGQSRRVSVDGAGNQVVAPADRGYDDQWQSLRSSFDRQIAAPGVLASSEFARLNRTANHLVNGAGLNGQAHTNIADGCMWHTALGRIENEYVLFDLHHAHRLTKCKIWNYNEATLGLYRVRGVSRVDIYVSASGRGNPLADPAEWKLMRQDEHLPLADGTDRYATPHEILFDGTETRFVALVIRSAHGRDPRYPLDPTEQCVGLSEVQFFGRRVDNP